MLNFGGATDKSVRPHNEDAILMSQQLQLFVVADGVGGLNAGDVASDTACRVVKEHCETGGSLFDGIKAANQRLFDENQTMKNAMATTMVAATIRDDTVDIVWAGDSRAYYFDGTLHLLTKDDSLVERLLSRGEISLEQLDTHPKRHVITKALGGAREINLSSYSSQVLTHGFLLLCSDGLYSEITPQALCDRLRTADEPSVLAHSLVHEVVDNKGHDNVSVIVIKLGDVCEKDIPNDQSGGVVSERYFDESMNRFVSNKKASLKTQRVASKPLAPPKPHDEPAAKPNARPLLVSVIVALLVLSLALMLWFLFTGELL